MKKLLTLGAATFILSACIGSGKNTDIKVGDAETFPTITGIDLLGDEKELPTYFEGDFNIVTIAFQQRQQENVNTWINALEPMLSESENLRFYELPVIYKMNPLFRTWINNGMRSGIPDEAARKRTITVYTDRAKFYDTMDMQESNIYTLLLNKEGQILWRTSGDATEEKLENLSRAIADAQ